jgi:parvulin-like peptidyl-prolyl isomerase
MVCLIAVASLVASTAMSQDYPSTGYNAINQGVPEPPRVRDPVAPGGYGGSTVAPSQPIQASRSDAWPGGTRNDSQLAQPQAALPAQPSVLSIPFERMQMVGRVGSEVVLVSDILAALDDLFERNGDQVPPDQKEAQRAALIQEVMDAVTEALAGQLQKEKLTPDEQEHKAMLRQLLKQQTEAKLLFLDAKKKIPTENFPNVEKQFNKQFEQSEVKKLMKRYNAETWRDLDQALKARGSSFERERRDMFERSLGQEWLFTQVKRDEEITYEQMISYYRDHPSEFDKPTLTRWQIFSIAFSEFPAKEDAYAAIAAMGNKVLGGEDFAAVAKASKTGCDGEISDWPKKGRVVSPVVEQAILGLPPGQMSPILEDWRGYHIVRVVERQTAHRETFEAAQAEIREKIKQERVQDQIQKYLTKLRQQTPIWTILDDKPPSAQVAQKPASRDAKR